MDLSLLLPEWGRGILGAADMGWAGRETVCVEFSCSLVRVRLVEPTDATVGRGRGMAGAPKL